MRIHFMENLIKSQLLLKEIFYPLQNVNIESSRVQNVFSQSNVLCMYVNGDNEPGRGNCFDSRA